MPTPETPPAAADDVDPELRAQLQSHLRNMHGSGSFVEHGYTSKAALLKALEDNQPIDLIRRKVQASWTPGWCDDEPNFVELTPR